MSSIEEGGGGAPGGALASKRLAEMQVGGCKWGSDGNADGDRKGEGWGERWQACGCRNAGGEDADACRWEERGRADKGGGISG